MDGPRHDSQEWLKIPPEIRDLKPLLLKMFQDIEEDALVECRSLEYAAEIEAHGGQETVADDLLRLVTPESLTSKAKKKSRQQSSVISNANRMRTKIGGTLWDTWTLSLIVETENGLGYTSDSV
ncbi:unnamed protein product [Penicillium glandicola]